MNIRTRLAAIAGAALSVAALVATAGTAEAATTQAGTGTTPSAVSATFKVVDSGAALHVTGSATGLDKAANYVSLIYPDNACNAAETPASQAVDGVFQEIGDAQRNVTSEYDGAAYAAVKGKVGSVSVRRIDLTLTPTASGPATVTATLTPIVCVDVK